jgi:hypothetical protein
MNLAIASTNIACGQTPKKTPNISLLLHDVITGTDLKENIVCEHLLLHDVITGTDHNENASTVAWLSIVACLSVAIATVVNTCHIAYSMHVTICFHRGI